MASPPKTELPVKKNAFVHKLYDMLNNKLIAHLIWWADTPEANTFLLCPNKEFSEALSIYFKHENVASFVRQLHMYGFHKVSDPTPISEKGTAIWEFRHSSGKFRKNDEASLVFIKRRLQLTLLSSQLDPFGTNVAQLPHDMSRLIQSNNGQVFFNPAFQQQQQQQQYTVQYIPVNPDGSYANFAHMGDRQGIPINPQTGAPLYHNQPMQILGQIPQQQFPGYAYFPGHGMVPVQGPPSANTPQVLQAHPATIAQGQDPHPGHKNFIQHPRFTSQGQVVMSPQVQGYETPVNNLAFTQYQNNAYPPVLAPMTGAPSLLQNTTQVNGPGSQRPSPEIPANDQKPGFKAETRDQGTLLPAISKQLPQPSLTTTLLQTSLMTGRNSSDSRSSVEQDNIAVQLKDDRLNGQKEQHRPPILSTRTSWDRASYLLQESITPISALPNFSKDIKFNEGVILRPLENPQPITKDGLKLELPRTIYKQSPLPSILEAVNSTNTPSSVGTLEPKDSALTHERSGSAFFTANNTSFTSSEPSSAVSAAFPPDSHMPKLPILAKEACGATDHASASRDAKENSSFLQSPPVPSALPKPTQQRSRGIASHLLNDDDDAEIEKQTLQNEVKSEEAKKPATNETFKAQVINSQVKNSKLEHLLEDTDEEDRKKQRLGVELQ